VHLVGSTTHFSVFYWFLRNNTVKKKI
jgi:hypothetical protein